MKRSQQRASVPPSRSSVNTEVAAGLEIRFALARKGYTFASWGRERDWSRTQVSLAANRKRTDRRSREILAALEKEISQ